MLLPESVAAGDLLAAQGGPSQLLSPAPGQVDAVLLSARNQGISGEGVLATVEFRVLAQGDPGLGLARSWPAAPTTRRARSRPR